MKFSRKGLEIIEKIALLGFIFLGVFIAGYYTGYFREYCGQDRACFDANLQKCKASEFVYAKENTIYTYIMYPSVKNRCVFKIRLERVAEGTSPELRRLEGEEMKCVLQREGAAKVDLDADPQFLQSCHGSLKEGMYEVLLQRMSGVFLNNLRSVSEGMKK